MAGAWACPARTKTICPRVAPSSSQSALLSLLFRGGRRVCALSGGLWGRIGRSLLTSACPHDETDDDHRCNNSRGDNAGIPIATVDILMSGPRERRINIGRPLRARIKRVLLGHWGLHVLDYQRAVPGPCSDDRGAQDRTEPIARTRVVKK